MALPLLPLIAPAVAIGKGIASGIKSLGSKKTSVKSVVNKREEQVKNKISPSSLPSISPRYYEKPKEAKKSTPKTSGGSVKSVKMTAESIKSSLLNQDKLLKTLKSNNAKLEREELERQKREQAVNKIKSGLKSIGSKLTSPIKGVTRGIGTAIPLLIAGILVNSLEGIISGIRNYYEKNLKPKVEFVQKKFDQLGNFLSNFSGDKDKVTRNREKVDKQVENLKKVIDENEIEDGVKKLEGVLNKGKFNNLSEDEKDKFVLEKLQTINPEIQSLTKDNSDLISSLPFNTNINTDTSNMYDENLLNQDSSEIVIVNRTLVVSE